MRSKEKFLEGSRLCVIIDRDLLTMATCITVARAAVKAGADIVQLRCKNLDTMEAVRTACAIRNITLGKAIFIVNDKAEVAVAARADGLHIGKGDLDINPARRLLGREKIIGISASRSSEAMSAKAAGASYIGVGPIFKTPIKHDKKPCGLRTLYEIEKLGIPLFAIGGINEGNIKQLTTKGFKRVAVIRAVSDSARPYMAVRRLREALS